MRFMRAEGPESPGSVETKKKKKQTESREKEAAKQKTDTEERSNKENRWGQHVLVSLRGSPEFLLDFLQRLCMKWSKSSLALLRNFESMSYLSSLSAPANLVFTIKYWIYLLLPCLNQVIPYFMLGFTNNIKVWGLKFSKIWRKWRWKGQIRLL